jgi:hypothetical protein
MNFEKHPGDIYTTIGMLLGYAAVGNTKEALKYGDKAMIIATDSNSKAYIERLMTDIKAGKDLSKM